MITLVRSYFDDERPDILNLQDFEKFCIRHSDWNCVDGPWLFPPTKISSRLYTAFHSLLRPLIWSKPRRGAILSLGLPYRHYLLGKTFPHFALNYELRALWTYDVWEPDFKKFERVVRDAGINLLMLSSYRATQHFRQVRLQNCEVHWVPESIDPAKFPRKSWHDREIDLLAFGRSYPPYHEAIAGACRMRNINYVHSPNYLSSADFINGLTSAKICVCFPRSVTHPELAGDVSTVTLRYLEAMAAHCLILGAAPAEAQKLLGYNPVVEIAWNDPVGQLASILADPHPYQWLLDRNFSEVGKLFHSQRFIERVERLVRRRLRRQRLVR